MASKPAIVDVRQQTLTGKKDLDPRYKAFNVKYEPENEGGKTLAGDFLVHRLNLDEIRRVAIRRVELNGGVAEGLLSRNVVTLNMMVAHLEFAIEKAPDWWKPEEFYDAGPISAVYDEVMKFEQTFRGPPREQPRGAEGDSSESPANG